jgi:RimJ/RimL family protein N-acetyltransferase
MKLSRKALEGRFTRLEPLDDSLREPLRTAISGPDPIWDLITTSAQGERFDPWWAEALSAQSSGRRLPFAVRRLSDGAVVGTTSFLTPDPANRSVEIGATFLREDARAGATNPDIKLAMLKSAFAAGAVRVEIRTDARNLRSQAAIAKLGAVREGVLRKQKTLWTGHPRDTVVFSVIDEDWPAVRAALEARLRPFGGDASPGKSP